MLAGARAMLAGARAMLAIASPIPIKSMPCILQALVISKEVSLTEVFFLSDTAEKCVGVGGWIP